MSESETHDLPALLEAMLFVAAEPITVTQLAAALGRTTSAVENGLRELESLLQKRGLRLQRHGGRVQLTTAPEMAALIERFLDLEATTRLSHAALEALSVIAYQQPATRSQVEAIRGVNCDGVLRSLLGKGLIQEVGRLDGPGKPILYGTTPDFMQYFGLNSLGELPSLNFPELTEDNSHDNSLKG